MPTMRSRYLTRVGWADLVHPPHGELEVMIRLASVASRAASRSAWRSACQRRTTRFASLLRMIKRLVQGEHATRTKVPGAWRIEVQRPSGPVLILSVITRARCRTVADFNQPIVVQVHEPELVNVPLLEELEMRGMVTVVLTQVAAS
jgi:hypothetical protein